MTEYTGTVYEQAEKYLRTSLAKWRQHLPELYEDAFQEGMIQVWRDVEAGVSPNLKIFRRAGMAAERFLHRNGEYFFGKPTKSRDGLTSNSKILEKVQVYLDEYLPVHNYVYPTPTECAKALGIDKPDTAGKALRRIKEGRVDHMVYRDDGRMDWDHYKTMSVEVLGTGNSYESTDANHNRSWTDNSAVTRFSETFEDALIDNLTVQNILNKVTPEYREVLYYFVYQQYTGGDIGRHVYGRQYSQGGTKRVNAALNQARLAMGIYQGSCAKGHKRSAETSDITQTTDGTYWYKCKTCREVKPPVTRDKAKSGVGDPCGKGHTKDKINAHGYARCSTCLRDTQRAYKARKAAKDAGDS